ncbi:hypothetical protein QUB35_09850 [Microcoleus sp. B13-B6]
MALQSVLTDFSYETGISIPGGLKAKPDRPKVRSGSIDESESPTGIEIPVS